MSTYYLSYPLEQIKKEPTVLALGYFDGIHKGHQEVLQRTKELAIKCNSTPGIFTFHPHPSEIVGTSPIQRYITPLSEKIKQFQEYGIEDIYIMHFNMRFAQVSKEEFVSEILSALSVKGVVTGFNFTFGKRASGKAHDLYTLSKERFEVEVVPPVEENGRVLSSTRVRIALGKGQIEEVKEILGRSYEIEGEVVPGDQRGRLMGFPTANVSLIQPFFVPRHGVYIVRTMIDGCLVAGIMNIGVRPTIAQPHPIERIEVHLFDWTENLYGKLLRIEFLHFLREERKFPSVEALTMQIRKDTQDAKLWLSAFAIV